MRRLLIIWFYHLCPVLKRCKNEKNNYSFGNLPSDRQHFPGLFPNLYSRIALEAKENFLTGPFTRRQNSSLFRQEF
jgi:hypothetical protein